MARVKAWKHGDPAAPDFPDEYEIKQKAVLQVTDIKTNRNNWSGWITIGRARNNDVILRHRSVSKLHARIVVEEGSPTTTQYQIGDSGSVNGTWVNESRLVANTTTALSSGDRVIFGVLGCEFLGVIDLHKRLRETPKTSRYEFD